MRIRIEYFSKDGDVVDGKMFDGLPNACLQFLHPIPELAVKAVASMEVPICCGQTDFVEFYQCEKRY